MIAIKHAILTGLVALLLPLAACNSPCESIEEVGGDDGTFSYTNGPGSSGISRGGVSAAWLTATSDSQASLGGGFDDNDGVTHTFSIGLSGISGGASFDLSTVASFSLEDDAGTACDSITGTLDLTDLSVDCRTQGCAVTVDGSLTGTATCGEETVTLAITMHQHGTWETMACPSSTTYGGGTEGS